MLDSINSILKNFGKTNALVIGDVMLDTYLFGNVNRISPEAPVPVVEIERTESRPGGAANVAMNIRALGGKVTLVSMTGNDLAGNTLKRLLDAQNISHRIFFSEERITTEKTRIFSRNHQMLRCDRELTDDLSKKDEKLFLEKIAEIIRGEKFDVAVLQDYNKGVLTKKVIQSAIALCNRKKIPVAVDPKRRNFFEYRNVTMLKPNLREVNDALGIEVNRADRKSLEKAAKMLQSKLNHRITFITLSESGAFITDHKKAEIIPAAVRHVADVSGAGDSVLSVAALCLAARVDLKILAHLANTAGGIACSQVGVATVSREQLMEEAGAEGV